MDPNEASTWSFVLPRSSNRATYAPPMRHRATTAQLDASANASVRVFSYVPLSPPSADAVRLPARRIPGMLGRSDLLPGT